MTPDPVILHITTVDDWLRAVREDELRTDSLDAEGFIHCSTPEQAPATAARYYRGREDLVLVAIDPSRLAAELRYEVATNGDLFPHIYGPLNLEAVRQSLVFPSAADGSFTLPVGLDLAASEPGIWVRATNRDGTPHWQHPALLVQSAGEIVITRTGYGQQVASERGSFTSNYFTRAHYWPDRWFNVIRLENAERRLQGFYCNIASPLRFDGRTVAYDDLQLDVFVSARDGDLSCRLLDEEDFAAARRRYGYEKELVERCYRAVDEVMALVKQRAFPFAEE